MRLMMVREDRHLHYPDSFPRDEQYRGGPGYVVDMDAPFEAEWCSGQEYKLVPAPDGSKPSPVESVHGLGLLRSARNIDKKPAAPEVVKVGGSLPGIDLPSKRSKD